ncbi:MAG TPA: LD-carboxypeptidase [Candidatus Saccharimonadales bacterium]|nr:LD-carboxypeptidase [Candidatus Saccharimonadales bacterium]
MKGVKRTVVGVWALSWSPAIGPRKPYERGLEELEKAGLPAVWAPAALRAFTERDRGAFDSLPLSDKVADWAWLRQSGYKVILSAIGGENSYQLLDQIDWQKAAADRVVLVGHSDFTALGNAYHALAGGLAWYGPNLRNLGDVGTGRMSAANLTRALSQEKTVWKSQPVYKDSFKTPLKKGAGWCVIRPGQASGVGIGGNLGTFFLLQGTPYMPQFTQPTILFLEEDDLPGKYAIREFDRKLRSILDQPGAKQWVRGLIIGRFLDGSKTTRRMIEQVIDAMPFWNDKPVLANVEIGHGMPRIVLPIGGQIDLLADSREIVVYNQEQRNETWL